jgi:signal transduction histidine kinase
MSDALKELERQYSAALEEYIGRGGESSLARAYELGRLTLASEFGVLEMAMIYQKGLAAVLKRPGTPEERARILGAAGEFLAESLAPFEMAHRGFRDANTALLKMNDTLRDVNAELETFAYSVSHDLRAPLRLIQGFSQALLEDYSTRLDEIGRDYARRIAEAGRRLDRLILDLLDYSRVSRTELRLQPVSLAAVVGSVLSHMEADFRERKADVRLEGDFPEVLAELTILSQIVTNLLTNAIKFVASDVTPRVQIWTEERAPWVRLCVRDNGIGIAPQDQERIFAVFQRLHAFHSYPGTGIGLAIVRKAVKRMGGHVGVESALGGGSRFWVELKPAEARDKVG